MGGAGPAVCIMVFLPRVECLACGAVTKASTPVTAGGTALGGEGLALVAEYKRRMPDAEMSGAMGRHHGIALKKTAMRHARFASAARCAPAIARIPSLIARDPWHLRDESEIKGRIVAAIAAALSLDAAMASASPSRLQALLAASPTGVYIRVAKGRSRSDIAEAFFEFLDSAFASDE